MHQASVILSWGPPRMGTTWLFNVIQRMIGASTDTVEIVADGVPLPHSNWRGPVLIKSHKADSPTLLGQFDKRINLFGFVMMRDPLATLFSLIRTQNADRTELIGWLESDVQSYAQALPLMRHGVIIREEWVADEAPKILASLNQILNLAVPSSVLKEIADEFDRESVRARVSDLDSQGQWNGHFENFDQLTQWHAGHIGPEGPRTVELTPGEQIRMNQLRRSIDSLSMEFSLWDYQATSEHEICDASAMDFVRAREREAHRALPLRNRLVALASRMLGSHRHAS